MTINLRFHLSKSLLHLCCSVEIMLFECGFFHLFIQIMGCRVTSHVNIHNIKQIQLNFYTFNSWDINFHYCRIYLRMTPWGSSGHSFFSKQLFKINKNHHYISFVFFNFPVSKCSFSSNFRVVILKKFVFILKLYTLYTHYTLYTTYILYTHFMEDLWPCTWFFFSILKN